MFPRSSNKPMQAVAMLRAGARLEGKSLALAAASHSGEDFHREGALATLASVGLGEDALQNTPDMPTHPDVQRQWIRAGQGPTSLAQNCSGKHAGMVAACKAAGWDVSTYLDPQHPLQQLMATTLADLTGSEVGPFGIDGCGAPVMATSLSGLARAFGRIASATEGHEKQVADAMRAYPEYVAGTDRDVTRLMRAVPGCIAKDGAEAVYAVGLADGRGAAVKIGDGGQRARAVVMAAVLQRMGVPAERLQGLRGTPILGHGKPVGDVTAVGI